MTKTLAEKINNKELTLEDKLKMIDEAMGTAQVKTEDNNNFAPVDPADATICLGCE